MFWYPFDVQECTMEFTLEKLSAKFVELVPEDLDYTGPLVLDEYNIMDTDLLIKTINTESEISGNTTETIVFVQITFGRGLFSIILTIYLTTILVNIIGHSAVFYKDSYFEAQVSLNVTVMLVQVTMFTSVSKNVLSEINLPLLTMLYIHSGV